MVCASYALSPPALAIDFTERQARQGQEAYVGLCASCHGADLEGAGIVPALVGRRFDQTWRGKPTAALAFHVARMPPGSDQQADAPGERPAARNGTHADILAFILARNGFAPSAVAMSQDPAELGSDIIPELAQGAADPTQPGELSANERERLARLSNATDAMLRNPPADDWLHWGRTYRGQSYSPLDEINRTTVERLTPAWRTPLLHGSSLPMPVVHDGVMFTHTYPDTVLAIDATSGAILWRYQRKDTGAAPQPMALKKMGVSLHEDRVYVATSDLHVIALNARTGELVWEHALDLGSAAGRQPIFLRGAPLVAGDVVIQGTMSFRIPKGSYIIAVDRKTGKEAWRFNTVAWPGQPGGESWNGLPVEARNGGSAWHQGTYDPTTNLVYYGIAPTYDTAPLLVPSEQEGVTNDAMYTNCTVALNADTGALEWYFQHTQNDQWDMDWVFERTIADLPGKDGATVKAVMNVGKNAMLDALNAETGEFLFSVDTGVQNVILSVDPITGEKHIDPAKLPSPETSADICPIPFGARSWPQTSYSPDTQYVYVPITESCFHMTETGKGGFLLTTGINFGPADHPDLDDDMMGRIQAIDVANRKLAWNRNQRTPPSTGLLSTAGGLVFSGDVDPSLKAFDDRTGELLWQAPLDDIPSSSVITYRVDGTQYVAVVVGMSNNHVRDITRYYRQWSTTKGRPGDQGGAAIWAFALEAP
jgi:alcohol dehydrogenase (cytochrome c)